MLRSKTLVREIQRNRVQIALKESVLILVKPGSLSIIFKAVKS